MKIRATGTNIILRSFVALPLALKSGSVTAEGAWVEYDLPGGGCFAITTLAEGVKPGCTWRIRGKNKSSSYR